LKNNFENCKKDKEVLLIENTKLQNIIKGLSAQNEYYKNFVDLENQRFETRFNDLLNKLFSPTQISQILHPTRKVYKWLPEDISSAITLRSISPKAYRYLRNKKQYPLPG